MSSCLPSCAKKKNKKTNPEKNVSSQDNVQCGNCLTSQPAGDNLSALICVSCHSVNRLARKDTGERRVSVVTPGTDDITLVRSGSMVFQLENDAHNNDESLMPESTVVGNMPPPLRLPQCSVCMDGAGDIVLLPCSHGGLCEECARHIAQNMAVGGAHCPRCRQPIQRLVRISNLNQNVAHAAELFIAAEDKKRAPPKVPPPPGGKKNRGTESS